MFKVDLLNLIPVFTRKKEIPENLQGKEPKVAAESIRRSCNNQADSYDEWSGLIRQNCPIPTNHPYRKILETRGIPSDDPLWTLGSIAFGTETAWVVFNSLYWPDGKVDFPEQLDMKWTKTQVPKAR